MALDPAPVPPVAHRPVILIVGGGYVGLYTALRLQKKLARGRAEIVVVDPQPHMTYQPFLPEAAAGSVEPATWWSRCGPRCDTAGSSPACSPACSTRRGVPASPRSRAHPSSWSTPSS